jgi:hypothetical protein
MILKLLLLSLLSFSLWAEDAPQIYTKESIENINKLNKAAELLSSPGKLFSADKDDKKDLPMRDPTQMSGNFRDELKKLNSGGALGNSTSAPASIDKMPTIELIAKVLGKNKSVMLRVNKQTLQLVEGSKASFTEEQRLMEIQVHKIHQDYVTIVVLPRNETLNLQ